MLSRPLEQPNGILRSALTVADLGLRVLPLVGKTPAISDWQTRATSNVHVLMHWLVSGNHNYGILCDEVGVIDTDTPELAQWWESNMPLTPWRVRTPRGGVHYFYRSVPGLRNAVKAHRGWDVRAGGNGYVVGFGSVLPQGTYELLGEATLDLPPFDPVWLPPIPEEPLPMPNVRAEPRRNIRDLQAYIRTILSIQGQGGSNACFRVACVLRDAGLTPEEALQYMLDWNATCAVPPWTVRELEKKIRDSFNKLKGGGDGGRERQADDAQGRGDPLSGRTGPGAGEADRLVDRPTLGRKEEAC